MKDCSEVNNISGEKISYVHEKGSLMYELDIYMIQKFKFVYIPVIINIILVIQYYIIFL